MRLHRPTLIALTIVASLALVPDATAACPAGTIDGTGDVVATPLGPLIIESCLSVADGLYTMTYEIHNESRSSVTLSKVHVPGYGAFETIASSVPPGLELSIDAVGGCVTWWSWKGPGAEVLPGASLALWFAVDGEIAAVRRDIQIVLSDGTAVAASAIVPSACLDLTGDPLQSCFCTGEAPTCASTIAFEGVGTQIDLLRGAEHQTLSSCEGSWLRHGFTGAGAPDESVEFRLEIDGVDVPLFREVRCCPSDIAGAADQRTLWYVQFPAYYFSPGRTYELTGYWFWDFIDTTYSASRTVLVDVVSCPIPISAQVPALLPHVACPDLAIASIEADCSCGWNEQKQFSCGVEVEVVVKNAGDADAGTFVVGLETSKAKDRLTLPGLSAGATRHLTLRLSLDEAICPLTYTVVVDADDEVAECDEENNAETGDVCCD